MARLEMAITERDALIVVDMQNDFITGTLAVKDAEKIIPVINRYVSLFEEAQRPIFFTRDWHPQNHISFKENGGVWPTHCVQKTEGASFHPELKMPKDNLLIISKGTSPDFDAYSGFQGTMLDALLKERGIKRIFVCGIATDYCVFHTALGGIHLGYQVFVLTDAVKGVDLNLGDSQKALQKLYQMGAVGIEL